MLVKQCFVWKYTDCCFKVLNEWVCVCFYNIIFKETRRQEIQTYILKNSAKWKALYFFLKKFSAKSLPKPDYKWTSQLRTNKSGNPVNGCPVFSCALPRNHCPLGRERRRNILQWLYISIATFCSSDQSFIAAIIPHLQSFCLFP